MKLNCKVLPVSRHGLFKILLAMKLTVLFIIAAMVNVSAKTYSQNINIHENRTSVGKILKLIKKQSGYNYLYEEDVLAKTSKVNVDLSNATVIQALDEALKDQPLTYKIIDQ